MEWFQNWSIQSLCSLPGFRHEGLDSTDWSQHVTADSITIFTLHWIRTVDTHQTIDEKDSCGQCKGREVVQDKKLL
uniref:Uncharacterized protein n=1 Tax=Physcomitrium patens TaxID=3218 RepID=A0A2K1IZT9_PHYPA|nr:hypothetical protein PHYPA_022677 [Physcomitrium patens]